MSQHPERGFDVPMDVTRLIPRITAAGLGFVGRYYGGNGGGAGPGPGGIGTIGQIRYQGGPGTDLDGLIGSGGTVMAAPGGDGAGAGGKGGVVNAAAVRLGPNQPAGGGGANYFVNAASGGSAGEIDLFFRIG